MVCNVGFNFVNKTLACVIVTVSMTVIPGPLSKVRDKVPRSYIQNDDGYYVSTMQASGTDMCMVRD